MRLILFCQYYRAADRERQQEIDACLEANLRHPAIDRVVLFLDADAPEPPPGSHAVERVVHGRRLHYRDWLTRLAAEGAAIGVLINADIELLDGLEHLPACLSDGRGFLALSRYNPSPGGGGQASLNDYPQWTQDCWALRSDAPISDSLLHASDFPLGFPGCDNRIAHVMWSYGFQPRNPCYHIRTLHRHRQLSRTYSVEGDRLYGGATYVHPCLSPAEDSELEHALWTRSAQAPGGLLIQRHGKDAGPQRLLAEDRQRAEPFLEGQTFLAMSWDQHCLGSVHAELPHRSPGLWPLCEDSVFLPLAALLHEGLELQLRQPQRLNGASLRLPVECPDGTVLLLSPRPAAGAGAGESAVCRISLRGGGRRTLIDAGVFGERPLNGLRLSLDCGDAPCTGEASAGAELVLFVARRPEVGDKSLRLIAAAEPAAAPDRAPLQRLRWIPRRDLEAALEDLEIVQRFGPRFLLRRQGESLLFEDRYWPELTSLPQALLPEPAKSARDLLLWGFGQPIVTLPHRGSDTEADRLQDWQPASVAGATELEALRLHRALSGPQLEGDLLHVYAAVPWSALIARGRDPALPLQALQQRLQALREQLHGHGLRLRIHSVCAHPAWWRHHALFAAAGIEQLWVCHAPPAGAQPVGIALAAWPLHPYPQGPSLPPVWRPRPPAERPFLASFQGVLPATATGERWRRGLQALRDRHRWLIEEQPGPIAAGGAEAGGAVSDAASAARPLLEPQQRQALLRRDSQFVLCSATTPDGLLTLWQAMAVAAVPVLLGEAPALPERGVLAELGLRGWDEVLLFCTEADLPDLPARLESFPSEAIERRSALCLAVLERLRQRACFGPVTPRSLPPVLPPSASEVARPCLTIPHYGEDDRYYWRRRKCGFYDIVLEWYKRGWIDIQFGEKGYFWWGEPGGILLFDRDLILDLEDGKVDPPRWDGFRRYRHGYFANQSHLDSPRHHRLTYWGYAPVQLEEMRRRVGRRPLPERCHRSVFAGTVENETQEFFRNKFLGWDRHIEVYACADRLNAGEPAPYSLPAYLELLASARFGIAFHGNGPRCYREIECLALGTPLIITEGVQTDYPEPLVEGLHFLVARTREEIERLIAATDDQQWERMSLACWQWFERNASISALFEALSASIAQLDLQLRRHDTVYLKLSAGASGEDPLACLAARSLRIMDPQARIVCTASPPSGALVLDPDDIVINELPCIGQEHQHRWRCRPEEMATHGDALLASEHPQHKQLCTLLGYRLRNFLVQINGPDGPIPPAERLQNGRLQLLAVSETARLTMDFDWSRRCMMKYPRLTRCIQGPALLSQALVMATLDYERDGLLLQADLSDHFSDYHAVFRQLIPAAQLAEICKLWRFECCRFVQVSGSVVEGDQSWDFAYACQHGDQFERVPLL